MRLSLLLAVCAAFVLAPAVSAQSTVKAWYQLTSGDRVEMVQADRIVMRHDGRQIQATVGRREMTFDAPTSVSFRGTGTQPTTASGRSGSHSSQGSHQFTTSETVIGFDGTSTTKVTNTTTNEDTGEQRTSTTTITTTASGDITIETTGDGDED